MKTSGKELSNEGIDNLSDAEFKTLVIRMLTEMAEYGRNIEEEVKAMQSEIKENVQGRKPGLKSMVWSRRKQETFKQNRMKQQELKKMRRPLGTSRTT